MKIASLTIRRPVATIMVFAALSLLGLISYTLLPVQLLPKFSLPQMSVMATMPGASPEKVERDLVLPIEAEISTLKGIEEITSRSSRGRGVVNISYKLGTDLKFAFLTLQQKVASMKGNLPRNSFVEARRTDTSMMANFLMQIHVTGPQEVKRLRYFAETKIRPSLEGVDGVSLVHVTGGNNPAVIIDIDRDRCLAAGVPVASVMNRIDVFHMQRKYLGKVLDTGREVFVTVEGEIPQMSEFGEIIVRKEGGIRLSDVAEIRSDAKVEEELFRVNGQSSVGIFILKDDAANLVQVSRKLAKRMDALNESPAAQGVKLSVGIDVSELIEKQLRRLKELALAGLGLAVLVLLVFLKNLRAILVILLAIPISILVTFSLMAMAGLSLNLLTLLGLALSIGMLIDNSIVVLENIFRHREKGRNTQKAAETGATEVYRAIIAGTLTTIAVFLPLLWIKTDASPLFADFALAVIFPMVVSLLVALTLVPMLASRLLSGSIRFQQTHKLSVKPSRFRIIYMALLKAACRHQLLTFVAFFGFLILTFLITTPMLVFMYVEERNPSDRIEMRIMLSKGSNLEATDSVVRQVEKIVQGYREIGEFSSRIRAGEADITMTRDDGPEGERGHSFEWVKEDLEGKLKDWSEISVRFDETQFARGSGGGGGSGSRRGDPFGMSGPSQKVVLRGAEFDELNRIAGAVEARLKDLPGVDARRVRVDLQRGQPEIQILGDRYALALREMDMLQLMSVIWAARREGELARYPFKQMGEEYDVVLRLRGAEHMTLDALRETMLTTPTGEVPLTELASIRVDEDLSEIRRVNRQRQLDVIFAFERSENTASKTASLRREVDDALYGMRLPAGYTMEVQHESTENDTYKWMAYLALALIFMILGASFGTFHHPILVMLTIPLALIGVMWGLVLTGTNFEMIVFMAMLILLGVVVNNGIFLVDHAQQLERERGFDITRAVVAAGCARYRPVFMTAATTVLGMLPLAFKAAGENEIWPPFAIAVIGGLSFSTVTTLVFIPSGLLALRSLGRWFRYIGIAGTLGAAAASIGAFYLLGWELLWITSTVWRWVWGILMAVAFLGIASLVRFVLVPVKEHPLFAATQYTIAIRKLTKVYGEPIPFVRDLRKWDRWVKRTLGLNQPVLRVKEVVGNLIWKVPLAALLVALHFFFESTFWRFVLSWTSLFFFMNLLAGLRFLLEPQVFADAGTIAFSRSRRLDAGIRFALALANAFHVHFWLELSPVFSLIVMPLGFLTALLLYACGRIRRCEIRPDRDGLSPALVRWWYKIAALLPVLGRPGEKVRALSGVDLDIGTGMFGLLGPNGAGKTTLMRLACNILEPSRGKVFINGYDAGKERNVVQSLIGYLPQDFGLYETLRAREFLHYHALLCDKWDARQREDLVERVLAEVGLAERASDRLGSYSGGMKQRAGIARTLLHLPRIIVVDEPTVGLDPRERVRFRNFLSELAKERIVIFSTHIVEDISGTCRVLAVLDGGEVKFCGPPDRMMALASGSVFEAMLDEETFNRVKDSLAVIRHLRESDNTIRVRFVCVQAPPVPAQTVEPTLEDAYVYLIGNRGNNNDRAATVS